MLLENSPDYEGWGEKDHETGDKFLLSLISREIMNFIKFYA